MLCRSVRRVARVAALALCTGLAAHVSAQALTGAADHPDSRVDIYGGYGYFHPFHSKIDGKYFQDVTNPNATASISYYFSHFMGVQVEGGYFSGSREHAIYNSHCPNSMCDQIIYTAEAGPVFRLPLGSWVPFIHALGGGERTNGPVSQPLTWGWGVTGGGGVDYILPFFSQHLAIRPIQADFQYSHVNYGPLQLPAGNSGGIADMRAVKLSGGLTLRLGETQARRQLAMGCTTAPISAFPGDAIEVTASLLNFNPRRKAVYTWQVNGGRITPNGQTAVVDTTGLAPGEYTISGHVMQGMKAREQADCSVPFTVKQVLPPTVSCAASPATASSGTPITINTVASSPSNRPLSYSYATTAGSISGTGPVATLTTAGLSPSNIIVTCNVADDLGGRASTQTTVTISPPPVPVIPQTQQLCSLSFARDRRRPARVDNEAKACLDDVALTLSQQPDATLVMVGNTSPSERPELAAERTLNARQYLVREKGIDPGRIDVRVGETSGRTLDNILVPSGATYNNPDTQEFNERSIQRHGEAYGIHHGPATSIRPRHATRYRRSTRRTSRRRHRAASNTSYPAPLFTPAPTAPAKQPETRPTAPGATIQPLK